MIVIKPLQLNSHLVQTTLKSRKDLFKSSNFQGFKYKTDISPASENEAMEFRVMTKDEMYNHGENLVNSDVADMQSADFRQKVTEAMERSKK